MGYSPLTNIFENSPFCLRLIVYEFDLSIKDLEIFDEFNLQIIHHLCIQKKGKGAKIRSRYNQVPHPTQDTNGKATNSQTPQTRAKRSALSQQVTTKHI